MPGLYAHTTRSAGTILTAAIYNADHNQHIEKAEPRFIDDMSPSVTDFRRTRNPGTAGSETLPVSLQQELEIVRWVIHQQHPTDTHWYTFS